MIMRIAFAAFCAGTLLATAASAQETRAVSVGANVSSLGVGVEAGYRINPYFGLRGGANYSACPSTAPSTTSNTTPTSI
jgi:hypothetical protein